MVEHCIYLELVVGETLSSFIRGWDSKLTTTDTDHSTLVGEITKVGHKVGRDVSKIHSVDAVHGDLTPSNVLVSQAEKECTWIDFGSSRHTTMVEDKAVDLYVLERAMCAMGRAGEVCWSGVLEGYASFCADGEFAHVSQLHREKISKRCNGGVGGGVKEVLSRFEKGTLVSCSHHTLTSLSHVLLSLS